MRLGRAAAPACGTRRSSRCRRRSPRTGNRRAAASRTIGAHLRHVDSTRARARAHTSCSFCRERLHELIRAARAAPARSSIGPVDRRCRPAAPCVASIGCVGRLVERRATARHVEVLERQARTGSITPWHLLQLGSARCCSRRARIVFGFSPGVASKIGLDARRRRRRRRAHAACSSTHAPRSTGDVRSPYDVRSSTAPLPSRPRRFGSSSVHAAELRPVHAAHAVVAREPLVDERVVGRQQLVHAVVLEQHAREEQLDLGREIVAQRVAELGEQALVRVARRRARRR